MTRRTNDQREFEQLMREARSNRHREREVSGLEAELHGLEARSQDIRGRLERLRHPVGIAEIRDLVEEGRKLTADETARMAAEDADLFNRLMDERSLVLGT
jgi:hypothetical protein